MNMRPTKFGVGQSIKRVEDVRLVSGRGNYASDAVDKAELKAVFLRSPYGHAKFRIDDIEAARAAPGVRAVYVASDFAELGGLPCLAPVPNADGSKTPLKPYPVMAADEAQHVGDIVAMVVADTTLQARDAAELISVTWEELPAVIDMEEAIRPGAPLVFAGAPGNIAYDTHIGDQEKTDAAFAGAAHTVRIKIVNSRVVANYMEPRSAVGEYDAQSGRFTLNVGSQGVHGIQGRIAEPILKIPPESLRVVTQDVGGGFGTKTVMYREYPLVLEAARRLGRRVGWLADRSEHFVGDAQGRDNVTTAEMALDSEGRFLALRVDILGNLGAYLSLFAPYIPWLGASMATGPYHIDALYARVRGVYTHTVPVDAYRGAGRPEAAYVLERLVDACARKLGIAPEELRARNFVRPEQMPYHTHTDRDYDVGDFEGAMRACLKKADQRRFRAAGGGRAGAGQDPRIRLCELYRMHGVERLRDGLPDLGEKRRFHADSSAPSPTGRDMRPPTPRPSRNISTCRSSASRSCRATPIGSPTGFGTGGSRSIPIGAVMVSRASETLAASLKELAADKLEAAVADLEIADGKVRIAGTDRAISYAEIAALPGATADEIDGDPVVRAAERDLSERHPCMRGRDRSGHGGNHDRPLLRRRRLRIHLNPLLLAGQVHGGIAQGAGQALMERAVFDREGQLLTASFLDYCMPRADNLPQFDFETRNVPSTTNPMGLKGAGEAGSIGSTPAVMNAVADALWRAYRIEHIDMPATPFAVYSAIKRSHAHA